MADRTTVAVPRVTSSTSARAPALAAAKSELAQRAGELACVVGLASDLADRANNDSSSSTGWQVAALLHAVRLQAVALHEALEELEVGHG